MGIEALFIDTKAFDDNDDPGAISPNGAGWTHQISVDPILPSATIVSGTIALAGIPYTASNAQAILDEAGAPVVFDLSDTSVNTVIVTGVFSSFTFTPTSVVGSYNATVLSK